MGRKKRYAGLAKEKDYRKAVRWARWRLCNGQFLCTEDRAIIEKYGLTRFDGVKVEKRSGTG